VRVTCCRLDLRRQRATDLEIDFLTDMALERARGDAGEHCAAGVVNGVVAFSEPPRVIVRHQGEAFERRDFEPGSCVVDVLPADLIGETVLVMRRGIELIERAAHVVCGVLVA
jgi:hypothetical protein